MKYVLISFLFFSCGGTKTGTQAESSTIDTAVTIHPDSTIQSKPTPDTVTPIPSSTGSASPVTVNPSGTAATDKIALYFGSMASGPIGDDFLKEWLVKFNKNEKAAITADKFSACGKEGEYIIVIYKNGFDNARESKFTSGLEKLINEEVRKRKADNPSSGSVEIRKNPNLEEYSFCRLGSKKWL